MPSSHRRHFGSIRKLPSGRFQTSYWHKDRHYLAPSTFRTKGDAQAWLSSIETDIARGTWLDPTGAKVTVGGWLQHWLATVVDGRVDSDNTRVAALRSWARRRRSLVLGGVVPGHTTSLRSPASMATVTACSPEPASSWFSNIGVDAANACSRRR